jgi:cellulose synthase/poly-beta-1,6-N-acetylglucosamine synthase-like glycosyltransferase
MRSIEIPQPEDRDWKYRLFEILPAFLTFSILALPVILGKIAPKITAYLLVAYLLLWFMRAVGLDIRSIQGWRTMKEHKNLPWRQMLVDLQNLEPTAKKVPKWHARNLKRVGRNIPHTRVLPSDVYHAVIIAFYNESRDIVEPTVQSVLDTDFDHKKIILYLAYEERGGPEIEAMAHDLVKKFGQDFYCVAAVKHPANIKGEVIGKGGNVTYTGNSFWNVVLSLRPHLLRNFSAHAQPMAALIDTDFWSVRTIVEDGHQFWRTWFRYDGNYQVFPIYVPIYQDAVLTEKYRKTLKMQFVQVRRWAWGASDIAYVANQAFFKINNIPPHKKIAKFFRLLEGHLSWSTAPLVLLLAAYPLLFFHTSSIKFGFLANELPQYASGLQRIAMVGILISLYLSMRSLPPKPLRYKRHRNIWMIIQWVYLPITSIVYSAAAAIYAQTRLALGKYLGFVVTEKASKSERANVGSMLK